MGYSQSRIGHFLLGGAAILAIHGCVGGSRVTATEAAQAPPSAVFVVFQTPNQWRVDRLTVGRDSLHGTVVSSRVESPREALHISLNSVDSIVRLHPDREGLVAAALPFAVGAAIVIAMRIGWGPD